MDQNRLRQLAGLITENEFETETTRNTIRVLKNAAELFNALANASTEPMIKTAAAQYASEMQNEIKLLKGKY